MKCKFEEDPAEQGVPPTFKKTCKKLSPLPVGAELHNRFRGIFIPTYERWVGMQSNPWLITDDVALPVLQDIWDTIYDNDVPWTVTVGDCVFERVRVFLSLVFLQAELGHIKPTLHR